MSISTAKRFTIFEYNRLTELGFFAEDDRVELIKGEIIQMAAKGTLHSVCNTRFNVSKAFNQAVERSQIAYQLQDYLKIRTEIFNKLPLQKKNIILIKSDFASSVVNH